MSKPIDCCLNLCALPCMERNHLNPKGRCISGNCAPKGRKATELWIKEDAYALHVRCSFFEDLEPFCPKLGVERAKARDIAAASRKAWDEACPNRIGDNTNTVGMELVLCQ